MLVSVMVTQLNIACMRGVQADHQHAGIYSLHWKSADASGRLAGSLASSHWGRSLPDAHLHRPALACRSGVAFPAAPDCSFTRRLMTSMPLARQGISKKSWAAVSHVSSQLQGVCPDSCYKGSHQYQSTGGTPYRIRQTPCKALSTKLAAHCLRGQGCFVHLWHTD